MNEFIIIMLFILGLLFIIRGGDLLVEACLMLSRLTGISKVVIGATLISLATALPEISVSLIAIANKSHSLAVGNAIGSMICNIALVLGIAIIIAPQKIKIKAFKNKANMLLFLNILLFIFCLNLKINLFESIILIALCVIFFWINLNEAKKSIEKDESNDKVKNKKEFFKLIVKFIIGGVGIFVGSKMLVSNGELLALLLGIGSEVIGLTLIAFGTCLPELITTVIAVKKKSIELALGNIIGANIINITLLFGVGSLLSGRGGLNIPTTSLTMSIPILIMLTFLLIYPILNTSKTHRIQGVLLFLIYILYTIFILSTFILGISA